MAKAPVCEPLTFLILSTPIINSILFVLYAPRGPKPAEIEGLNAFEIRILPLTFLAGSTILFVMFVLALNRYEQEKTEAENTTD